jgi:MFS-type transporter involved in bile tolerance (Atg22 family)
MQEQTPEEKVKRAWTMYDWANSPYALVITTAIFPIFFNAVTSDKNEAGEIINDTVQFFGVEFINTQLYSYVLATSFFSSQKALHNGGVNVEHPYSILSIDCSDIGIVVQHLASLIQNIIFRRRGCRSTIQRNDRFKMATIDPSNQYTSTYI